MKCWTFLVGPVLAGTFIRNLEDIQRELSRNPPKIITSENEARSLGLPSVNLGGIPGVDAIGYPKLPTSNSDSLPQSSLSMNSNPFELPGPGPLGTGPSSFGRGPGVGPMANGPQARLLSQQDVGVLNNYGCWCYFQENVGKGRGIPQDNPDSYCRTLHQGYECIMIDHDLANDTCIPWEVEYGSSSGIAGVTPFINDLVNLIHECDQNNPVDSCARKACKVEGYFLVSWLRWCFSGGINGMVVDFDLRHDFGFTPDQFNCPGIPPEGSLPYAEERCCGEYPFRQPYKHSQGYRECCDVQGLDGRLGGILTGH